MHDNFNICDLIVEKLKEKEQSVAWISRQVGCDGSDLRKMLKNNFHIHSELLLRISIALKEDFFVYYSEMVRANISHFAKHDDSKEVNFTRKTGENHPIKGVFA